jgi:hypothetical protein
MSSNTFLFGGFLTGLEQQVSIVIIALFLTIIYSL